MADFFQGGRKGDVKVGGVFNGTDVRLSLGSAGDGESIAGALVQRVDITYRRQVQRVLELGSYNTYYIIGRSEGEANMQNIVGPSNTVQTIIDGLADACKVDQNALTLSADTEFCATSQVGGETKRAVKFVLTGAILTQMGVTISTQDFTIVQTAGIMFASLSK